MHIDFEAKIMAVQLTLDADEVKIIANLYHADANRDMETGYRHSARTGYQKAAWYYRAIGETWWAERMESRAKSTKED